MCFLFTELILDYNAFGKKKNLIEAIVCAFPADIPYALSPWISGWLAPLLY